MDEFMVFEEEEWEPSTRVYAPVPLEYYKEMRHLTAGEFGELMRILLYFNITGKVPPVEGVLCHYVDRVIGRQIRFYRDWADLKENRSKAGKKSAETRRKKIDLLTERCAELETFVEQNQHVLNKDNYSNSNSNSNSDSNSDSNLQFKAVRNSEDATGPAAAPGREVEFGPEAPVADAMFRLLGIRPSRTCLRELRDYVSRLGTDTCIYAVERAAEESQCSWKYVRGILRDMDLNGIRSRSHAENCHRSYVKPTTAGTNGSYQSQFDTHDKRILTELEKRAIAEAIAEEF